MDILYTSRPPTADLLRLYEDPKDPAWIHVVVVRRVPEKRKGKVREYESDLPVAREEFLALAAKPALENLDIMGFVVSAEDVIMKAETDGLLKGPSPTPESSEPPSWWLSDVAGVVPCIPPEFIVPEVRG